jgi:hypothetical protein
VTSTRLFGGQVPAGSAAIGRARRRIVQLEAAGLSRREIARRAGVAASSITKLANERQPRISRPVTDAVLRVRA